MTDSALNLSALLGQTTVELLQRIARAAESEGTRAFLVGGVVRDLLLGRPSPDIDIMLEGDATVLVPRFVERWDTLFSGLTQPKKPVLFPKFKTAKLNFREDLVPGVQNLDFSSARGERYPAPGQPPEIFLADLETDLRRRDFSVNALGLELSGDRFGKLIDVVGGEAALRAGTLTILHPQSFRDDPARLIRGVRFAERFGFRFDDDTADRFREAVKGEWLKLLTPQRRFDELRKALQERKPIPIARRLGAEELLLPIYAELQLEPPAPSELAHKLERASFELGHSWEISLAAMFQRAQPSNFEAWLRECKIAPQTRDSILETHRLINSASSRAH